ncbi:methyl-accepting chemotaxis protein [Pseudoduganella namucuonensis]|uniref:Methyl-accepting chemotaxis protein n=1 Tax=Pseudoduganella namucuonensis TaxID=1035707 RepID=A0A1I7KT51_9BURK|nr:methyl-accepting chemotaxis protein [Pseudoduganella namucuonensis]SFV00629.1 methyl-accepting chemotaxis protein [Pseudoduganella namucuonensis]
MKLTNLNIGVRLAAGYALVLVLLAGVALFGINGLNASNEAMHHIVDVNVEKMRLLEQMSQSTHVVARVIRTIALQSDEAAGRVEFKKIERARADYADANAALEKMQLDQAGRALMAEIKADREAALPLNNRFQELSKTDREAAVAFLLREAGPATTAWQDAIHKYMDLQRTKSRQDQKMADDSNRQARTLMLGATAAALLLGAATAWAIGRSITVPLAEAVRVARTVASGDLGSVIRADASDEVGQLLRALKDMNDSLHGIVCQVRGGADTIATASCEIAQGNLDLSSRTERQAGSLQETASSMEELTSIVKQNAEHARRGNELAGSASTVAVQGGAAVAQVVDTMDAISASSKKIADIIGVIDGIAFQTNILALNAAVEAARAGEQGRGFAVVASEVRNLAHRSAAAAKEIKSLIGDSVQQVGLGVELVGKAGATMESVVQSINGVAGVMADISSASEEQTAGIEQINQAICQMDQTTQQNAALVEQAAAAASSLEEQAAGLTRMVAAFRTGAPDAAPAPSGASRRRGQSALRLAPGPHGKLAAA